MRPCLNELRRFGRDFLGDLEEKLFQVAVAGGLLLQVAIIVPQPSRRPRSMMPMRSASSWAISRVCVVRKIVMPPSALSAQERLEFADTFGVEPHRRLVGDQEFRVVDERRREHRACACRANSAP